MARRKGVLKSAGLVSAMVGVLVCVVVGQRLIASSAFNALESATVAGDAHRVAVAVTYETRLLNGYGATNSIWDSSYDDVSKADRASFLSDFPPSELRRMYQVDAAIGIDAAGRVRAGGLIAGNTGTRRCRASCPGCGWRAWCSCAARPV